MSMSMQRVIVRFKHPSGSSRTQPSAALREALMLLSEAEELDPLVCEAETTGKIVTIEMFQSRNGIPILIHFGREEA